MQTEWFTILQMFFCNFQRILVNRPIAKSRFTKPSHCSMIPILELILNNRKAYQLVCVDTSSNLNITLRSKL